MTDEPAMSKSSMECSICLESFCEGDELICLPCGHRFHLCCLDPWIRTCGDCPCCRRRVNVTTDKVKERQWSRFDIAEDFWELCFWNCFALLPLVDLFFSSYLLLNPAYVLLLWTFLLALDGALIWILLLGLLY
ncbi:E3 ubiquitin-protein ligase RNF181-like [Olea europaea var. sylvestris]|uniref:E3 ubiquitin-protein ligase RNF181-like n=1 Tax=Olea europaea var. sylvestris TaxID=158386 RepID=UPI000C1CE3E0|nr:E3 ubiquitin-protein ligase RNF181-like [Olea europaea var. sylvestris]